MKKLTKEINEKNLIQLEKEAIVLREEIAKMILETRVNPVKDTNTITKRKKRLAVILTLITQKRELDNLVKK